MGPWSSPLVSTLELTLSGLIIGSRVDTAGDNQSPNVIVSKYLCGRKHLICCVHGNLHNDVVVTSQKFLPVI